MKHEIWRIPVCSINSKQHNFKHSSNLTSPVKDKIPDKHTQTLSSAVFRLCQLVILIRSCLVFVQCFHFLDMLNILQVMTRVQGAKGVVALTHGLRVERDCLHSGNRARVNPPAPEASLPSCIFKQLCRDIRHSSPQ